MSFLGFADDAVVLVTGAGSGIGEAVAIEAAREGLAVVAWDLRAEAAEATAAKITDLGGHVVARGIDVSHEQAVSAAWSEDSAALGPISHVAGVAGPPSFVTEGFTEAIDLCLRCMRTPIEQLVQLQRPDKSVVVVASVQGPIYGAGAEWYTVAKAAIDGYMRSLAAMRPGGVRANSILPDWTLTPRTAPHLEAVAPGGVWPANPMGRPALPIDCAKTVLFLLSPAAGYLNGLSVPIDGGMRLRSAGWLAYAQPH